MAAAPTSLSRLVAPSRGRAAAAASWRQPSRPLPSLAAATRSSSAALATAAPLAAALLVAAVVARRSALRRRWQRRLALRVAAAGGAAVLKEELLSLCGEGLEGRARVEAAQRFEDVVNELVATATPRCVEEAAATLEGRWRLLSTYVPGQAAASITSLESWRKYIFAKGPSPVQAGIFSSGATQRVYQTLELGGSPGRWSNVVDALPYAVACIQADLKLEEASTSAGTALRFQWTGGFISLRRLPFASEDLPEPLRFPYPVPFELLGDRARGSFDTLFLDSDLHVAKGTKSGSMFILAREIGSLPMESEYYNPA